MRVALYARVSTAEEKQLQDPGVQTSILEKYCELHGHEIVETFVDHASGSTAEGREAFKRMMDEVSRKDRRFDAVVVLRLDRFMRDSVEGMFYFKKLQDAGCKFIMVKDEILGSIDTSTDLGEFFLTVVFALGKLERRRTIERSKEGIGKFKDKKGWWGRGCPNPQPGKKGKRTDINLDLAIELLKVRGSFSKVAKELGVPRSTLQDRFDKAGVDYQTYLTCRNTPPEKSPLDSNTPEGEPESPEYARNPAGGNEPRTTEESNDNEAQ